ncbi:hypothetical protein U3516DRAFT_750904 [Neocallimastix sp. 'constans']
MTGINKNDINNDKDNVLSIVITNGYFNIINKGINIVFKILETNLIKFSLFLRNNEWNSIGYFAENGVYINEARNTDGENTLILPSRINNTVDMKYLIKNDINILKIAFIINHYDIAMCMFNKESKLLKIKNDYINYFKITCKNSHLNIARYLFNKSVLLTEELCEEMEDNYIDTDNNSNNLSLIDKDIKK